MSDPDEEQGDGLVADFAAAARLPRVHLMIAASTAATARLAPTRVRDLLAAASPAESADQLIALVELFARLDRSDC